MKTYTTHDYEILIKHLDAAERRINAITEILREELLSLGNKKRPAKKDVKAAALMSERICNHMLAAKYVSEASGAMGFYKAVLEGLADEDDYEYEPDFETAAEDGDDAGPEDDSELPF